MRGKTGVLRYCYADVAICSMMGSQIWRRVVLKLAPSLVAGLPLFAGLTAPELDQILRGARAAHYRRDAIIFEQASAAHYFFLLLNGHVRVVRAAPGGRQIIARYFNEGELFGIAVAIGRTVYPASAIAAVDCVVVAWPNSQWPDFIARFPNFVSKVYGVIGDRLQETQDHVLQLSTAPAEQRIAQALLRLANQSGRKMDDGVQIGFPITRQDIAEMTGTTLHTVSRLLSRWERQGIVRGGRQKVFITDLNGLMGIAEKPAGE
jgi:CRP/FNR family transcriptional regulator, nitrogen oxide reductase regulator